MPLNFMSRVKSKKSMCYLILRKNRTNISKNIVIKYYNRNGEWPIALIENVALSLMIIGIQNLYIYIHTIVTYNDNRIQGIF